MSLKRRFTDSDIRNLLDEESEEDDLDENMKLEQKRAEKEKVVKRRKI
jgi:hypothetical protein